MVVKPAKNSKQLFCGLIYEDFKSTGSYDDSIISKEATKADQCSGKKIKAKSQVNVGQEVIVRYKTVTLNWKQFESHMVIGIKIYERI